MDNKGQGALEYLLLIAGAVLIAAVVIMIVLGMVGTGNDIANERVNAFNEVLATHAVS